MSGATMTSGVEKRRIDGIEVRVFSPAKTVVDCFRYRNKVGLAVAIEALREAWRSKAVSMAELTTEARKLRMERVMRCRRTKPELDMLFRGMPNRNSPFRFALTLLLALAIPFCCCDFRTLLGGCGSCEAAGIADPQTAAVPSHEDEGHVAHSHCHGHAPKGDDHGRSEPGKAPSKDRHDCTCGKNTGKMLAVEKSPVELPAPVIVAILDWSGVSDCRPYAAFRGHHVEQRAVDQPATTLLRMHCALIV